MDSLKNLEKNIYSIRELVNNFESKENTEEDLLKVETHFFICYLINSFYSFIGLLNNY